MVRWWVRYTTSVSINLIVCYVHLQATGRPFGDATLPDIHQHFSVMGGGEAFYSPFFYLFLTGISGLLGATWGYHLIISTVAAGVPEAAAYLSRTIWGEGDGYGAVLIIYGMWLPGFILSTGTIAASIHLTLMLLASAQLIRGKNVSGTLLLASSGLFHTAGATMSIILAVAWMMPSATLLSGMVSRWGVPARTYTTGIAGAVESGGSSIINAGVNAALWLVIPLRYGLSAVYIGEGRRYVYFPIILGVVGAGLDPNLRPLIHSGAYLAALGGRWVKEARRLRRWGMFGYLIFVVGTIASNAF